MSARRLKSRTLVLGDQLNIGLKSLRNQWDSDLSGDTATVTIYSDTGATVLGATAMTITGTTSQQVTYFLRTGTALTITAAGTYRAVYRVTDTAGDVQHWEQQITVLANPFA